MPVLFLSRHFVEKRVVASRNIGCFLRLQIWGPMQGIDFRMIYNSQEYVSRDILGFVNKNIYFWERFLLFNKLLLRDWSKSIGGGGP